MAYRDDVADEAGRIELPTSLAISDCAALLPVVLDNAGTAQLPDFLAAPYIADGRLVRLWPAAAGDRTALHAIYPSHRSLSAKVRVFTDSLIAEVDAWRT